jgi:hypothetical protein
MLLIVPLLVFSYNIILSPWLLLCNLIAGILIVKEKKNQMWFLISLLGILIISFVLSNVDFGISKNLNILKISIYLIFFLIVYIETTKQVWKASLINNNIVYGLISGYVSLGLIGFFINLFIETIQPNSFNGLLNQINASENLLYYSYVTLLTIGFGEITPSTSLTQKTALIIGLCGEIYQALITAIIVGKYINQTKLKKTKN